MFDTFGDLLEARFSQSDMLSVCGLKAMTLQNWNARGLGARPSGARPGTGNRRAYSAVDVLVLAVMKELTGLKIPVSFAHELATDFVAPIFENSRSINDPLEVPLNSVCVLIPRREKNQFDLKWHLGDDTLSVIESSSNSEPAGYIVLPASRLVMRVLQDLTSLVRPQNRELTKDPNQLSARQPDHTWDSPREIDDEIEQTNRYQSFRRAYEKGRSESD